MPHADVEYTLCLPEFHRFLGGNGHIVLTTTTRPGGEGSSRNRCPARSVPVCSRSPYDAEPLRPLRLFSLASPWRCSGPGK